MSVSTPLPGEAFTIRIYKRLAANPALAWSNTYEVSESGAGDFSMLMNVADFIVSWEKAFHLETVEWTRAIISTLVPDGQPYNPLSFVTRPQSGFGVRVTQGSEPMPLHLCYRVQFSTVTGRQGYRLFRGCLLESDVSSPAGEPRLNVASNLNTTLNAASQLEFGELFSSANGFRIVLATVGSTRDVLGVSGAGITVKKMNNRYFDKP